LLLQGCGRGGHSAGSRRRAARPRTCR
jgi:hypothetical protein